MKNFGASWITTAFGAAVIVLTWLNQIFVDQGFPKDGKEWLSFLTGNAAGLIGLFAKQFNVTNSQHPAAAVAVPPTAEATPNPAATVQ